MLSTLTLTNFKNYQFQEFDFCAGINGIAGLNGVGKTNILEAIYYLCMCKNNRNLTDRRLAHYGTGFFRLEGLFTVAEEQQNIVAKIMVGKMKLFECNGVVYEKLADHIGRLPVVMVVPDDTLLITEGSEERRRFLNNSLSQLDEVYLQDVLQYNRLLRQRNAALKAMAEQRRLQPDLLESYDSQLQAPAHRIFTRRQAFVQDLLPIFKEVYADMCSNTENVEITCRSDLIDNDLQQLLKVNQGRDFALQRTTKGIHKDELECTLNGHSLKRFGSQGQIKSFVFALKLAQYQLLRQGKNTTPILLLDDIFDKLDKYRVQKLAQRISTDTFGQVFITDTREERLREMIETLGVEWKILRL